MDQQNQQNPGGSNKLSSIKTFATTSKVLGVVSLFLGGTLLSVVGLVFALIGRSNLKELAASSATMQAGERESLEKSIKTGLIVCAIALALNLISLIVFLPTLLETMQVDGVTLFGGAASSAGSSFWG